MYIGVGRGRLARGGVDENGYGAIVDEIDFHVRAETAGLNRQTIFGAKTVIKVLIERFGELGACRLDKRGAVAVAHIAIERELRNGQNGTANIKNGAVHLARLVLENTQLSHLLGHIVGIRLGIGVGNADQKHIALTDLADRLAIDSDRGTESSLYDYTHTEEELSWGG